jgi:hypothetical protein
VDGWNFDYHFGTCPFATTRAYREFRTSEMAGTPIAQ